MSGLEQAIQQSINIERQDKIRRQLQSNISPVDQQRDFYNQQRIINATNCEQNINNL